MNEVNLKVLAANIYLKHIFSGCGGMAAASLAATAIEQAEVFLAKLEEKIPDKPKEESRTQQQQNQPRPAEDRQGKGGGK